MVEKIKDEYYERDRRDIAKASQLRSRGRQVSPASVELTAKELARHCRRETRGAAETEALLDELLTAFMGDLGRETLGVPLFDEARLKHTWTQQRAHAGRQQVEGGVRLPVYRCARGSTSLESFYLHLNRFIPGESAGSVNFQAYLLEGIARWNADRHAAAVGDGEMSCYNRKLQSAVVGVTTSVGAKLGMTARRPAQYTGELIGMEYLLSQTGEPLAPLCPEEEEEFQEEAEEDEHEDEEEEEEEEDEVDCDPTVVVEPESPASLAPPPASPSPPPLPLPDVSSASPAPPLISSSPPHLVPMEQPVEVELERLESPLLEQVQDEILAAAATDLQPPAEVVVQHPSEEALELPDKEERRSTAKQRRQTQTVSDVETSAQTQLATRGRPGARKVEWAGANQCARRIRGGQRRVSTNSDHVYGIFIIICFLLRGLFCFRLSSAAFNHDQCKVLKDYKGPFFGCRAAKPEQPIRKRTAEETSPIILVELRESKVRNFNFHSGRKGVLSTLFGHAYAHSEVKAFCQRI
ncbi:hypothetical protein RRG08_018130 [Elysia crispata]|uniref:Uncharacterized protein n=1 Tax=Elysia crispata TaxID=231223 RepID=A0AAE0YDI6_9GAST|nr:hypothetical protein RRG08_018130 [Elysia crispata]